MTLNKIPVGISSCLLGEEVRFNGGHKLSRFCVDHLVDVFDFVPECPEVAIGMGVPREPIRLVADFDNDRAVGVESPDLDVTDDLLNYGRLIASKNHSLRGYILMAKSPSCGLYSAKLYKKGVPVSGRHTGLFVRGLREVNPLLPLEEEGRLNNPVLRENFIARVFAYADWHKSVVSHLSRKNLVDYHTRFKYQLLAHDQERYRELGRLVADLGRRELESLAKQYIEKFMAALSKPASRKGHANVLYHLLGYLKTSVPGNVRQELSLSIEQYRKGFVNLAVPLALLSHYLSLYGSEYSNAQVYLQPYSPELGLRNNI